MIIPALTNIDLVFQREINYDLTYPLWYTNKYLETIYYDLPASSMNKLQPNWYLSDTKKNLDNPIRIKE